MHTNTSTIYRNKMMDVVPVQNYCANMLKSTGRNTILGTKNHFTLE